MSARWDWPGSRWWKCDLHIHTPASHDFADKTADADAWLRAARAQGLEAVAVTDHNSGRFIGKVLAAARAMADPPTVFPGVELTVSGGSHLLVLFNPEQDEEAVTALLGHCEIPHGDFGSQDACSTCSMVEALSRAAGRKGLCIAAHVDAPKGFLKEVVPSQTLQQIVTSPHLHAVEVKEDDAELLAYLDNTKNGYTRPLGPLARLAFSDAHALGQIGQRFTWIKMTRPDLEGLRLALEDGPLSVQRHEASGADPNQHATQLIESIQVHEARYVGRGGSPLEVDFNPWLNAVIGGRGTGKSSLVEFLRIALRRDRQEDLPKDLYEGFANFKRIPKNRTDRGALLPETRISVIYRKDGVRFRIHWEASGEAPVLEKWTDNGTWMVDGGEVRRRFPVRLYSQKQIFELAEEPGALLRIIDEAPGVGRPAWDERWQVEESRFLALRAKAREIGARLGEEDRLKAEIDDVGRKLAVFEDAGHSEILRRFQRRSRQQRALEAWGENFQTTGDSLRDLADRVVPPDLEAQLFSSADPAEAGILTAARDASERLLDLQREVQVLAARVDAVFDDWRTAVTTSPWSGEVRQAEQAYDALVDQLRGAGAGSPDEYGRLVQERQTLERRLADLESERQALAQVQAQADQALAALTEIRRELTRKRSEFLQATLAQNPHVRIEVTPFGEDEDSAEAQLRKLLGTERFKSDIRSEDGQSGLIPELFQDYADATKAGPAGEREQRVQELEERLAELKRKLIGPSRGEALRVQDQRFLQHLAALKPETLDRLEVWFPEDSLRVSHRTDHGPFRPLEQGSPGQKAAAILAFLLSHGEEPMVLDQPEDDLDNQLISELLVQQLRENKTRRQFIVVTHNPNVVVNGDAEMVLVLGFGGGRTYAAELGGLQEQKVRDAICRVMEGGREALERRYRRIGRAASHV